MKTFRIFLILLGLVAVVFAALKARGRLAGAEKPAGLYGGAEGLDTLRKPDRTTVWRLKPAPSGAASTPASTAAPAPVSTASPAPAGTAAEKPAEPPKSGDGGESKEKGEAAASIHPGYVEEGPAVAVPPALAAELSAALASSDSYLWDSAKGCAPRWGAKLAFFRGTHRVDVLLCYECKILETFLDGRRVGQEDFDSIAPLLISAACKLFPEDEELRKLASS